MRYFKLYELIDKETYLYRGEAAWDVFNPEALIALDDLRDFLGVPLIVNNWWKNKGSRQYSGYRPESCPIGARFSQHKLGNAFDPLPQGMTAEEARQKILADQDNPLVSRITRLEAEVGWCHFDLAQLSEGKHRIYVFKG